MFKNGGAHEGPLGEARHIFGKKKAKEECARLTLRYLQEVRERRVSYGRRMMEGVGGGGEGVGKGKGTEAEEGRGGDEMRGEDEMDGEAEGEEFEDALEEMDSIYGDGEGDV